MIFRQDYAKLKIVGTSARRSRRIEKQVEQERNRKEKTQKSYEFSCKYCYQNYRTYTNEDALKKLHQRDPKCDV